MQSNFSRRDATKRAGMDIETYREEVNTALTAFEQAIAESECAIYTLRLYVTGTTPRSIRAIANLRKICEEHLEGRYDLEVIDLYQQPHLAQGDQIVAAPTLIKKYPFPVRRIIGDMSDTDQVLIGLDLLHRAGHRAL